MNKNLTLPDFSEEVIFNHDNGLGHLYKVVPLKDLKSLTINWPNLPEQRSNWKSKPMGYISSCVGHEGKNSLLSELIKQDLAIGLSAGPSERLHGYKAGF